MNGNRNGYNNSRPNHFSAKRSRSRSPPRSTYNDSSRFNNRDANDTHNYNTHGNDYKRPRTDSSRPPHVSIFYLKEIY
jgi:hypothetical protein